MEIKYTNRNSLFSGKMRIPLNFTLKEYLWNILIKVTNNYSNFKVNNLGNGYVKCDWEISNIDNFRIKLSKSSFLAIRLFDATNNRIRENSTCIMKEIQINKFQSSISFQIPINKGVYYFELGYRKKDGEWRKLAFHYLNLGYSIKKIMKFSKNDNWFDTNIILEKSYKTEHEKAYKLSLNRRTGGSENILDKNENS